MGINIPKVAKSKERPIPEQPKNEPGPARILKADCRALRARVAHVSNGGAARRRRRRLRVCEGEGGTGASANRRSVGLRRFFW